MNESSFLQYIRNKFQEAVRVVLEKIQENPKGVTSERNLPKPDDASPSLRKLGNLLSWILNECVEAPHTNISVAQSVD